MAGVRTANQTLVREINLSIILNALREHSPRSRAALAAATGLNKTTVSSLVQELIDARFVVEIGAHQSEDTGRPGILLALNPRAGYMIGVEIGVDFILVILANFAIEIVWRRQVQTDPHRGQAAIIRRALSLIRVAVKQSQKHAARILGLGLGVPGLVDVSSGTLLFAPNLGWRDVPLRKILEAKFDFPIHVDNEAHMAALGESYFGAARRSQSVLYVSAGVGLGGGIVLDGRILPGATGFAGEVGHMTMSPSGLSCNCGNHGCWETLASQRAVFRYISDAVTAGKRSTLTQMTHGDLNALSIPLVVQAAQAGDSVALKALEENGLYLGIGLANLINLLNPERVVFGGILSEASEFVLPVINRVIRERALRWSSDAAQVLVAAHGSNACVMGAVATVYHHILNQPSASATGTVHTARRSHDIKEVMRARVEPSSNNRL